MSKLGTILGAMLTGGLLLFVVVVVFALDDWVGLLAFKLQYGTFCLVTASVIAGLWLPHSRRSASCACLATLLLLMSPYLYDTPSSRILRKLLIDVKPGTPGDDIENRVRLAYQGSGYVLPQITRDPDRVYVSLLSQSPGNCTAAIFYLAEGVVIRDEFSAD